MITVHQFVLYENETDGPIMGTQIDNECNPMVDKHFWNRFLEGNCTMQYIGSHEEEEDEKV
jgi:hypothetical protein